MADIIRAHVPDKHGKTIPPDVTMGSYELRDLDHTGVGYLYEGKLVIDKSWGHEVCQPGDCHGQRPGSTAGFDRKTALAARDI